MKLAIIFEASRDGYTAKQVAEYRSPITVGELKDLLEDYNDDTLFMLSHDNGYTHGSISKFEFEEVDIDEVKDELLYKVETLQAQLADLDKEKAKEIVLEKSEVIKKKAEELYKYAIEKGTPVVEKAADEVRVQALKVVKEAQKRLEKKDK